MLTSLLIHFSAALALSLLLTPVCRRVSHRFGLTAKPKSDRWHQKPTALFGGVAIAASTLIVASTLSFAAVWPLLICGALIAAFGFADDLLTLKPSTKLIAQIGVAALLLAAGYRLHWAESLLGDTMLTLFWIVGITNAFNLLDNMDGLCAGTAIITGAFLLIGMAGVSGATASAYYLAAVLGATAGFLVFNVHPASIFMGDTGSLFLGLNMAALSLVAGSAGASRSGAYLAMGAPVALLLVPILDTTFVTVVRLLSGRRPSQGGRDHTSHRLVAIGLTQSAAVRVLWMLGAAGGGVGLAMQHLEQGWSAIFAAALLLSATIFAVYLARIRVYNDADFKRLHEGTVTPVVVDFMYKRRVVEVLLDVCLSTVAYYSAYRLRFDGPEFFENYPYFLQSLPVVVVAQMVALFAVGGYRGIWRTFGMMDAVVFARGVGLGTLLSLVTLLFAYRFESYSRAAFVIYAALFMLMVCASRASFRLIGEFVQRRNASGDRCLVYGTSGATLATVREAFGDLPVRVIGFIDDDPRQRQMRVGGYTVLGGFDRLVSMIEADEVDSVVLNTRMIDVDRLRQLERLCQERDVSLLRLRIHVEPVVAVS